MEYCITVQLETLPSNRYRALSNRSFLHTNLKAKARQNLNSSFLGVKLKIPTLPRVVFKKTTTFFFFFYLFYDCAHVFNDEPSLLNEKSAVKASKATQPSNHTFRET